MSTLTAWFQRQALDRQISQAVAQALKQGAHPLGLTEYQALYHLHQLDGQLVRVSDLSAQMGLSISATSRLLSRFAETCQVIDRQACPDDKRALHIHLTPQGHQVLAAANQQVSAVLAQFPQLLADPPSPHATAHERKDAHV